MYLPDGKDPYQCMKLEEIMAEQRRKEEDSSRESNAIFVEIGFAELIQI